jgi:signal peptidase
MATTRPTSAGRPFAIAGRLVDLVLLSVIGLGLTSVLLGRVLPAIGHPVFVVAGPSMVPALEVGTAIALDPVDPAELRVGDIVSLTSGTGQTVFTHRIIRVVEREEGPWIETKGDANEHADPSLTPVAQVIGRVGVAVPYAGYLLTLVSSLQGVVLLLAMGATLLVLGWWLDDLALDRRRRAARVVGAAPGVSAPMPSGAPVAVAAVASGPVAMPARAVAAMRTPPARRAAKPAKRGKPVESALPNPGTISAADLLRSDPNGHRRRRRADLARG